MQPWHLNCITHHTQAQSPHTNPAHSAIPAGIAQPARKATPSQPASSQPASSQAATGLPTSCMQQHAGCSMTACPAVRLPHVHVYIHISDICAHVIQEQQG
mmetsp:Transcript_5218/g.11403  ORF Transcript_5218/g.11403 Transcript_5218/m.11403 type:complete len:101 (+) Transcript_5218:663-965(+)